MMKLPKRGVDREGPDETKTSSVQLNWCFFVVTGVGRVTISFVFIYQIGNLFLYVRCLNMPSRRSPG